MLHHYLIAVRQKQTTCNINLLSLHLKKKQLEKLNSSLTKNLLLQIKFCFHYNKLENSSN